MGKKKKTGKMGLSTYLLFIAGFTLIGYPIVTQAYAAMHQTGVVNQYDSSVLKISEPEKNVIEQAVEKRNAEVKRKAAAAAGKADERAIKAMVELNQKKDKETKASKKTGKPLGVLSIPELGGLRLPIYDGISDAVLSSGAGLIPGTSMPQGGDALGVSSVITSHSGLPNAKLFTSLGRMKLKDKFYIEMAGKTLSYKVDRIKVVKPEQLTENFNLDPEKNYVTLMTCTPIGVNTHRLLVRGHLVPTDSLPANTIRSEFYWLAGFMAILLLTLTRWIRGIVKRRQGMMAK